MKRFVFLGDSITDCYHNFDSENLGEGYVRLIHERLYLANKEIQIINKGFDGFTLAALKRLWKQQSDTLLPDVLTILIGINDVGVIHNTGMDPAFALAEFKVSFEVLLNDIRKKYKIPIIIMEPFLFPYPEKYKVWFDTLTKMNQIIKEISQKYNLIHIPLWETMLQMAEKYGYDAITTDGIHLTTNGHSILADKWLEMSKKAW